MADPRPSRAPPAQRIVSLAPHLTELVFTAGAGSRLVGVAEYSDYPPAAKALPRIGDAFRFDLERLSVLKPDLVLAWESGNPAAQVEQLRDLGYRVATFRTRELEDVATALIDLGRLTGTEEQAGTAASAYLEGLRELRAGNRSKPVLEVFYQIAAQPLFTVNGEHSISRLIEICNGRNIFAGLNALAPVVDQEAVIRLDPQVILAGYLGPDDPLSQWRRWSDMRAVAAGHLYRIDPDVVARASVRLLQGGREICAALDRARG